MATSVANSSPVTVSTTDIADIITEGVTCSNTSDCNATTWMILFILTFTAMVILSAINIFICCRARGQDMNMTKMLLLCKRRNYDIEKNEYSSVPTNASSSKNGDKLEPCGKPPESDYEMPMGFKARMAKSFTFPRTTIEAENLKVSGNDPETSDPEFIPPSGSVKAKRQMFESGDKNANLSSSRSDVNLVKSNLDVVVSSSRGSGIDDADSRGDDSAPEDMAPGPYEKITFRKNSRKGRDGQKKPRTERPAEKVLSTVIMQKDGTMEIKVDKDVDDDDRISMPDEEPPPLPYDRITYPPRKKERQCSVM